MVVLTLFSHCFIETFQCSFHNSKVKFIILNSYEYFKIIESSPQLNLVKLFRIYSSSDSSVSCHPSSASVLSIVKSYHIISESRIQIIFPNIIGSNFCQLQTYLTSQCFVQIALLNHILQNAFFWKCV